MTPTPKPLYALVARWQEEANRIRATIGNHAMGEDDTIAKISSGVRSLLADELEQALREWDKVMELADFYDFEHDILGLPEKDDGR